MRGLLRRTYRSGQLARVMGPRWLAFRALYALRKRTGALARSLPVGDWDGVSLRGLLGDEDLARPETYFRHRLDRPGGFFFSPADRTAAAAVLRGWDSGSAGPGRESDELRRGTLRYFSRTPVEVGCPPPWHTNPFSGQATPADRHWSRISDFRHGDIKVIWEASRFGFVFPLVRAYWRDGDEARAELFWSLVEDWGKNNQPQRGANWKCGQEVALRVMAWCFGLFGFLDAPATTPERVAALARMVAVSARRIEANVGFGVSQSNNHGVSEAAGLWTVGLLFPELRHAGRWLERGRDLLESQARDLIYDDGAFSQQSLNYQRLVLHDYLWCVRLGEVNGRPLSGILRERVGRSGALLYQLQDPETGRVPNYGQNDGALVLPLNNCRYEDFRPVTQAVGFLTDGSRRHPGGPWDEDLFWLFGAGAVGAPVRPTPRADLRADAGGYYTLRSPTSFAFTRCPPSFRHRPGQADLLHVDLWWRGSNVALDPGTYSYNSPVPWDNALSRTCHHNTVTVDGADQMERVSRFLWLPWARGRTLRRLVSAGGRVGYWEGEHDGYRRFPRPVNHRRAVVRLGDDDWLILDELTGRGPHLYRLHWLLPDLPYRWHGGAAPGVGEVDEAGLTLTTPRGPYSVRFGCQDGPGEVSLARADPEGPRGWASFHYLDREPALSVALARRAGSARFWTWFGPAGGEVDRDGGAFRFTRGGWEGDVVVGGPGVRGPLASEVRAAAGGDSLRID